MRRWFEPDHEIGGRRSGFLLTWFVAPVMPMNAVINTLVARRESHACTEGRNGSFCKNAAILQTKSLLEVIWRGG
jgi:hypothetical protein